MNIVAYLWLKAFIRTLNRTDKDVFREICIQQGGKPIGGGAVSMETCHLPTACRQFAAYLRAKNGRQH